ncbi:hypothetical protein BKA56DRAFT_700388 [Ilyonectria sp. MPI-CAGE-AT-0026]|nr:hypothetical protein BKA56DRAFT_700388 [Ilyonectria sp. MPI-CAGE-AT-0026]
MAAWSGNESVAKLLDHIKAVTRNRDSHPCGSAEGCESVQSDLADNASSLTKAAEIALAACFNVTQKSLKISDSRFNPVKSALFVRQSRQLRWITPQSTKRVLDPEQFDFPARKKTFLSNIARGKHDNTDTLLDDLRQSKIRGVAFNITNPEPLPAGHPLAKRRMSSSLTCQLADPEFWWDRGTDDGLRGATIV